MSILGYEGTLNIGGIAHHVRDVNVELSATEIDDTTRNSGGWQSRRAGLRQWGVTFDMIVSKGDSIFKNLLNAFKNHTFLSATVSDKEGNSIAGQVSVTGFNRSEPLDGVVTVAVTLVGNGKPTITLGW